MIIVGMDDTDNLESRGTGRLARDVAAALAAEFPVLGVTRHQLLVDPRVPCTKNNSSKAILLDADGQVGPLAVQERVRGLMLADYQAGSDPGLCVARRVPAKVKDFGQRTKRELVTQKEARELAARYGIPLLGLGGDENGVIGALAAVGLAATGEDGRYVLVGRCRELTGLQPVAAVLAAGVAAVLTSDGSSVTDGLVQCDKLRAARRGGRPVVFVQWQDDHWFPLILE